MIQISCAGETDTRAFAGRLASALRPDDVILLAGGLGSGKTVFAGGLAAGLGVEEQVVSPSFVLVRQYHSGFMPLIHVDVYRLGTLNEFDDLDVFEMARDGVLVIEWGDAVEPVLPDSHLRIEFEVRDDDARTLRLVPSGSWADRDLKAVV